jgi:hypothetical protein
MSFRASGVQGIMVAALVAGLGAAPAASAEDFSLITGKGYASLGTFSNESEIDLRIDGTAGEIGTDIDWDKSFGNVDDTVFRLDGLWRFNENHHLRILATDFTRKNKAVLDEDIEFRGDTILAGSSVTAEFSFMILEAAYEYALKHTENLELALSAGLHWTALDTGLKYKLLTPGSEVSDSIGNSASVDLPLPVFGGHALWRMGGDFYLDAMVQWFALSIDEYDGGLINYRAAVIWQPSKWVGIGVGYDSFNIDVDVDKSSFKGSLDWTYAGPQIFYNVSF